MTTWELEGESFYSGRVLRQTSEKSTALDFNFAWRHFHWAWSGFLPLILHQFSHVSSTVGVGLFCFSLHTSVVFLLELPYHGFCLTSEDGDDDMEVVEQETGFDNIIFIHIDCRHHRHSHRLQPSLSFTAIANLPLMFPSSSPLTISNFLQ